MKNNISVHVQHNTMFEVPAVIGYIMWPYISLSHLSGHSGECHEGYDFNVIHLYYHLFNDLNVVLF